MIEEKQVLEFTVSRLHMEKALDHYRDHLLQKYPNRFLTAAFMHTMETYLNQYQKYLAQRETNVVWRVPVKILGDARTNNIDVTVADNVNLILVGP